MDFRMRFHRKKLLEVEIGGVKLIPRSNYHVIELPPPLDEPAKLREVELRWFQAGFSWFAEVAGDVDSAMARPGLLLTTTCLEGDRWVRHATMSGHQEGPVGWQPFTLSGRVGPDGLEAAPEICEVVLMVSDGDRRRATLVPVPGPLRGRGMPGGPDSGPDRAGPGDSRRGLDDPVGPRHDGELHPASERADARPLQHAGQCLDRHRGGLQRGDPRRPPAAAARGERRPPASTGATARS